MLKSVFTEKQKNLHLWTKCRRQSLRRTGGREIRYLGCSAPPWGIKEQAEGEKKRKKKNTPCVGGGDYSCRQASCLSVAEIILVIRKRVLFPLRKSRGTRRKRSTGQSRGTQLYIISRGFFCDNAFRLRIRATPEGPEASAEGPRN